MNAINASKLPLSRFARARLGFAASEKATEHAGQRRARLGFRSASVRCPVVCPGKQPRWVYAIFRHDRGEHISVRKWPRVMNGAAERQLLDLEFARDCRESRLGLSKNQCADSRSDRFRLRL